MRWRKKLAKLALPSLFCPRTLCKRPYATRSLSNPPIPPPQYTVSKKWGGGIMGAKNQARTRKEQAAVAKEMAKKI